MIGITSYTLFVEKLEEFPSTTMSDHQFKFFKELSSIPMVSYGLQMGTNIYQNLKHCHHLVDRTLSTTEHLIEFIANAPSFQRMAHSVETPLSYVDNLASSGLHLIENKYPSIRMSPEELKDQTQNQMIVLRGHGAKRLEDFIRELCRRRQQNMVKVLEYFESLLGPKLSVYVDLVERTIDDCLPPIDQSSADHQSVKPKEDQKVLLRMAYIPRIVQQRIAQRYYQYVLKVTFVDNQEKVVKEEDQTQSPKQERKDLNAIVEGNSELNED